MPQPGKFWKNADVDMQFGPSGIPASTAELASSPVATAANAVGLKSLLSLFMVYLSFPWLTFCFSRTLWPFSRWRRSPIFRTANHEIQIYGNPGRFAGCL